MDYSRFIFLYGGYASLFINGELLENKLQSFIHATIFHFLHILYSTFYNDNKSIFMQTSSNIVFFLVVTTAIILLLASLIVTLIYLYQKKQLAYHQNLGALKLDHDKTLLKAQMEIQEQTFQNISREIHDNISLSLTLAKLNLNTLNLNDKEKTNKLIKSAIDLVSKSINDLSDISKSLNPEVISNQGLITAIEKEMARIRNIGLFEVNFKVTGNPVFMDAQKELIIFRIVQESFNNIIKHAKASQVHVDLYYDNDHVDLTVKDNGCGFSKEAVQKSMDTKNKAGLGNMQTRARIFNGVLFINSKPGSGTSLSLTLPY